jgi:hypothetical protein
MTWSGYLLDLVVLLELWRRGIGVKTGAKLLEA